MSSLLSIPFDLQNICMHSVNVTNLLFFFFILFYMLHLYCYNKGQKWAACPTLAKQKAVRGMMPYWANTAIATPLGFTMWCWKETKLYFSTAMITNTVYFLSEHVCILNWWLCMKQYHLDLGHLHGASQWNHSDE